MLSSIELPHQRRNLFETRRAMPQLNLSFIDIPIPETCLWEGLNEEQKQLVVEALARLMVKAARAGNRPERTND
jgi:hypothetical protein